MTITINANNKDSIFVTNEHASITNSNKKQNGSKNKGNSIFAGDLGLNPNTIEMKRKLAQKKAMKIVSDTFASEQELDNNIKGLYEQKDKLREQALQGKKDIAEVREEKAQMMENYGITEDSDEHKNLELLRKERDANMPNSNIELTDDEKTKLEEIHANGITDYQRDMLELDEREQIYQTTVDNNESAIKSISSSITDIGLERLKSRPILKATQEADKIMEAANKELIADLQSEAIKHVEEKMEEIAEKAEEKAEKQEEADEKAAERKKDKLELEKQIEKIKENSENIANSEVSVNTDDESANISGVVTAMPKEGTQQSSNKELEKIADELQLIMEDLKGAKIDTMM